MDATGEITLYYATIHQIDFRKPQGSTVTEYKLSVRETLDWQTPSMCDAVGTISGDNVVFQADTLTQQFATVCKRSAKAWLEIYADNAVFLQREILISGRAGTLNGQPPAPVTLYYTKAEVDALLLAKVTLPSGGTAGQALVMTEGGTVGWGSGGGSGTVKSVNNALPDAQGNVTLTAGSVGALPVTGGTLTGPLLFTNEFSYGTTHTLSIGGDFDIDIVSDGNISVGGGTFSGSLSCSSLYIDEASLKLGFGGAMSGDKYLKTDDNGVVQFVDITAGSVGALSLEGGTLTGGLFAGGDVIATVNGGTVAMSDIKNSVVHADTIPTAGATYSDKVYLYTGTTSVSYKHGHLYQCKLSGGTYSWVDTQTGLYGVGNLTGIKCFVIGGQVTLKWGDPEDTKIGEVIVAKWGKTVLVRKSGGYPTGVEDGTVLVSSTVRDAYKTTAFNEQLPSGETYYYRWFIFTDDGVLNDNSVNEAVTGVLTWVSLLDMCNDPTIDMRDVFSAGDVLTASNSVRPTDGNGNFQWQVTDVTHDDFGLAAYKIFANLQFDAPQKAYGLTADTVFATWKLLTLTGWGTTNGTYFLKDETATGNSRVWRRRNGTYEIKYANGSWIVFNFANSTITATQTTAAADPWGGAWSNNIVVAKSKKYFTTDGTTYTEATVTDGDAVTANTYYEQNPHNDRVNYGSNDYEGSPLDQMLNSDGNAGTFLQPNTIWSNNPSWASSEAGFKKGFDPDFLAAVKDTDIVLNLNNVTAGGGQKTLTRKFFLLSSTEVGLASGEGNVLDFYNGVEATARIKYNLSGGAQHWWLRSPYVGNSYYVSLVHSSGTLYSNVANYAYGCVPACRIGGSNQ